jgi:hypothetical protein
LEPVFTLSVLFGVVSWVAGTRKDHAMTAMWVTPSRRRVCVVHRDENGFGIFRYFENRFQTFSIGFIGNGIFQKRNRFSKSAWCFTDRFLRLPVFVGNYRICVLKFSGIMSQNFSELSRNFSELCLTFFGIFQHVIFRIACTSLDKDYLFLYFLDVLRFFWG